MIRAPGWAALVLAVAMTASTLSCTTSESSGGQHQPTAPGNGTSSRDEPYQPTDDDRQEIRQLLQARADALATNDERAFLATVDRADEDLVDQQRILFDNLALLPVRSVDYGIEDAAGLPPADLEGDDPVFRPTVIERVQFAGVDRAPVGNELEDTFVKRDDAWLLGAETLAGDYPKGEEPQSRPWGGGIGLAVARRGDLLVVVDHEARHTLDGLADAIEGYIRADAGALDLEPRYDVMVDATSSGSVSMMNTLDESQAAAVTFPVFALDDGGSAIRLGGMRVKINPEEVQAYAANAFVLKHELAHFLTYARLGSWPAWLTEGLADYVATQPSGFTDGPAGVDYAYLDGLRHELPTTAKWGLDPQADYLIARAAVTYLADTFGTSQVLELGTAYEERRSGDDPDQVTRRLLPATLGITERELVDQTWDLLATLP